MTPRYLSNADPNTNGETPVTAGDIGDIGDLSAVTIQNISSIERVESVPNVPNVPTAALLDKYFRMAREGRLIAHRKTVELENSGMDQAEATDEGIRYALGMGF